MTGKIKYDRAKIQDGWSKILFAQVFYSAKLLYPAGQRRPVVCGYVKLFNSSSLSFLTTKLGSLFVKWGPPKKK